MVLFLASSSFDGPATTDVALAALAAEAGLLEPKVEKDTLGEEVGETPEQNLIRQLEDSSAESPAMMLESPKIEETTSILCENSVINQGMGLKGGGLMRPPKQFSYKMGLRGGSKDSLETTHDQTNDNDENMTNATSMNGMEDGLRMDLSIVKEEDAASDEEQKYNPNLDGELGTRFPTNQEMAQDGRQEEGHILDDIKKEGDDALSALASAALDHSKEIKKTENVPESNKEQWHTVGFIKGTSCDVLNYFMLENYSDMTLDNLPDLAGYPRIPLNPGTAYKFRVAAINSVGVGDWSEVTN